RRAGDDVRDRAVAEGCDAVREVEAQPGGARTRQRGDDDLVEAPGRPGLDDGLDRVVVAQQAVGLDPAVTQLGQRALQQLLAGLAPLRAGLRCGDQQRDLDRAALATP